MTIQGSVTRCTEVMSERDSIFAFCDNAFKAASLCREMAKILDDKGWHDLAGIFDNLRHNGRKLAEMKSMSRVEREHAIQLKTARFNGVDFSG